MTVAAQDVLDLFAQSQPLFTALGDERRQTIVVLLLRSGGALNVGEIARELKLSQPAVSHHLKILRDAGLLSVERSGTLRLYAFNAPKIVDVLTPMKELVELITECTAQDG
ncbi:metalloregulator ArsR/SmtB family transcription factor [Streptomyces sp. NPDC051940]|uniref:ArsR/SmtB family transcription factor n=1 Tax=Streptomyces sp. NPDC051940 TaxID=3155675 RepID=UPI00343C3BA2